MTDARRRAGDARPYIRTDCRPLAWECLGHPAKIPHQFENWIRDDKGVFLSCHFESSAHVGEKTFPRAAEEAAIHKTVLAYYWDGMAQVMPFPASSVHQAG